MNIPFGLVTSLLEVYDPETDMPKKYVKGFSLYHCLWKKKLKMIRNLSVGLLLTKLCLPSQKNTI